jgi:type IV conjugative transfer system coupling protein TraD
MTLFSLLTEGGQTWIHRIRMVRKVIKIASGVSMLFCSFLICLSLRNIPSNVYLATFYHLKAYAYEMFQQKSIPVDANIWEKISRERRSNGEVPINVVKRKTKDAPKQIIHELEKILKTCLTFSGTSFLFIILFFVLRGRRIRNSEHLSGRKIVPAWRIRLKLALTGKASNIRIGNLPMVKGSETRHTLITGGTGSGKTNCLYHILNQIRSTDQKVIIVDTTGSFVDKYYRDGKDTILNPFDARSVKWHPWAECDDRSDYDALAESFIPGGVSDNENYWRSASRSLVSSVLWKLRHQERTSEFCQWILTKPLYDLAEFVKDTKAASHIDIRSEKTAASIRSVASSFMEGFEFFDDTLDPFSIRDWVKQEGTGWLFLACSPKQRTVMRPILSSWVSIVTRSLFELPPLLNRRIWFVLDELPSMQRIKDLELFLTESRKYGGCGLISLQSPSQLESIYGRAVSETIISNCYTKIVFSEKMPNIAEEISRSFGKKVNKEFSEGISYGANDVRDGVSLSSHKKESQCVSATQIQSLKKNTAYVNLPENMPIAKIKMKIAK